MTQAKARENERNDLADAFELLREHHGDIAGVKKDVASLDNKFGQLASKVDAVLEAVTKSVARQGPSLTELMNGLVLLFCIIGGLSAGVGIFVSSTYSGTITQLQSEAATSRAALAQRDTEDRAELIQLRRDDRLALGERLKALEEHGGWVAKTSPAAQ
jgi:hypothetical protein